MRRTLTILALALAVGVSARAQLAITETMSSAANTFQGAPAAQQSDYWELANFGATAIDLTGYSFSDNDAGFLGRDSSPFEGLVIQPGEVILFVQNNVNTTPESVHEWWGPSLPAATRVMFFSGKGQSSGGDAIQMWDAAEQLVARAEFGPATRGVSFTYDTVTGVHGILSTNGVNGAFTAATRDDVGSPGVTAGPVALAITEQPPALTEVPVGNTATLTIAARGLPQPRFLWRKDGEPLGVSGPTLVIAEAQLSDSGSYSVIVSNGLESVTSTVAVLTVNPAPTPPEITRAPTDLWAYLGQTATFSVAALGNPAPEYQWRFNGEDLPGETGPELTFTAEDAARSGDYSVRVRNSAGTNLVGATLLVTRKPNLVITEVQTSQATNEAGSTLGHADWWELTNLDDFAVNLKGCRFDDSTAQIALAYTITNDVILRPGESVVFVEGMTAEAFREWWGEANLPPGLQIEPYGGSGLGLSSAGDAVVLWNGAAIADSDKLAEALVSTATTGVSFVYNPDVVIPGILTELAVVGVRGAFAAAVLGDVGSPGTIAALAPPLRFTGVARVGGDIELTLRTENGRDYSVVFKADSDTAGWTSLTNVTATGDSVTVRDAIGTGNRFYRAEALP